MKSIILKTNELTKMYGKTAAVDHVSLTIEQGDIYGFVGENGAGKTTFMRMICGLARPSSGSISLFGKTVSDNMKNAGRRIGCMIERPAIFSELSALENMEVLSRYLSLGVKKEEQIRLLELVGLSADDRKKAGKFSMGMKQRLGIAMTLLGGPDLLILDEPTVGLDPVGVFELRGLLKKIHQEENVTMLISSHNLGELEKLADKFGIMHQGKLLAEFTHEQVKAACEKASCDLETFLIRIIKSADKKSACAKIQL